jgi:hypothetical protein
VDRTQNTLIWETNSTLFASTRKVRATVNRYAGFTTVEASDVFQMQHSPSTSTSTFGILPQSRILMQLFQPFVTSSDKSGWYHAASDSASPTLLILRKSPPTEAQTVFAHALCRRFPTYNGD